MATNAIVKFEGREIPMDPVIAGDNTLLREVLIPHLGPHLADATITREEQGETMIVNLVKRAGSKGNGFENLKTVPEWMNPVFAVGCMLRWNDARGTLQFQDLYDLQTLIDTALAAGEDQEEHTRYARGRLKQAPAAPVKNHIPLGF